MIDVETFTAPDSWACGLINDDWSGNEDSEEKAANRWAESLPGPIVGTEEEDAGFMTWHDARAFAPYAANCLTYIVHVQRKES